nr:MAG TPA: hypothetical protein [Caudoviricetes sp.]
MGSRLLNFRKHINLYRILYKLKYPPNNPPPYSKKSK